MSDDSSRELQPVVELRRAVTGGAVAFLSSRPILRSILGAAGALLFTIGVIAAPFWDVPILSWLKGSQIAATSLAGGLGALGIWYLSRRRGARPAASRPPGPPPVDLVLQLERLKDLHNSGDLSDEEFKRAKTRVLD